MSPQLSHEVEALREAVTLVREQAGGRRCRFPRSIRERAVSLLEQGASTLSLARATGLRVDALQRWSRRPRGSKARKVVAEPHQALPRQAVHPQPRVFAVDAAPAAPAPSAGAPLRLQFGAFVVTVSLAMEVA
jgi:transposase-like protein